MFAMKLSKKDEPTQKKIKALLATTAAVGGIGVLALAVGAASYKAFKAHKEPIIPDLNVFTQGPVMGDIVTPPSPEEEMEEARRLYGPDEIER